MYPGLWIWENAIIIINWAIYSRALALAKAKILMLLLCRVHNEKWKELRVCKHESLTIDYIWVGSTNYSIESNLHAVLLNYGPCHT